MAVSFMVGAVNCQKSTSGKPLDNTLHIPKDRPLAKLNQRKREKENHHYIQNLKQINHTISPIIVLSGIVKSNEQKEFAYGFIYTKRFKVYFHSLGSFSLKNVFFQVRKYRF